MAFPRNIILLMSAALMAAVTGCASTGTPESETARVLRDRESRIAALENEARQREARINSLSSELSNTKLPAVSAAPGARTAYNQIPGGDLLPPSAEPGECYARLFVPPKFETRTEQVLRSEASTRVETQPAKYAAAQERVLVREASSKLVTVPATYKTVTERVLVEGSRSFWRLGQGSKSAEADDSLVAAASKMGLDLANASAGSCFEERVVPARFETRTEQVLSSEASARVDVTPARYEMVDERVLVQEAGTRIVEVPATYDTITERILVKPATTEWKKGSGPIERVDDSTGEIMCLVEVPAVYKTVTKRVVKTPATTKTVEIPAQYKTVKVSRQVAAPQERRIEIPAEYTTVTKRDQVSDARRFWVAAGSAGSGAGGEGTRTGRKLCKAETPERYKTVTRRVVDTPATTKTVAIPAEYKTVSVRKLAQPASSRTIEIPAEYATVTKRVQVADGQMAWREILCETNTSQGVVRKIQAALKAEGYNPGPVDGVIGGQTLSALKSYQSKKGLATGGLTLKTLKSLGVL